MAKSFLLNPFTEANRLAEQRGKWVIATIDPRMSWPTKCQLAMFDSKEFLLLPQSHDVDHTAAVALRADKYELSSEQARSAIMRFCSALSWREASGISIIDWTHRELPKPASVRRGKVITHFLEFNDIPVPSTENERAAIALYREGISLDNSFYGILSLYKVISILMPKGKERAKWIVGALARLDDHRAKQRRSMLEAQGVDLSKYIRESCRNAVAHAEKVPFVNPDDVDDHFRLSQDVPLLRNLAELAIEEHSQLKRSQTLWREHLYELEGFKKIIPKDVVSKMVHSEPVPAGTMIEIPERFLLIARKGPDVSYFENMQPELAGQIEGGMVLDLVSQDIALKFRAFLNFADEKLSFDPIQGVEFSRRRTSAKYIRCEINLLRFTHLILTNGHLEFWDQEHDTMLGRTETYLPVNAVVDMEFYESEMSELRSCLEKLTSTSSDMS